MMAQPKKRLDVSPIKVSLAVDSIASGAKILAKMGFDITKEVEVLLRAIRNQIIVNSYDVINLEKLLREAQTIGDSGVSQTLSQKPEIFPTGTTEADSIHPRENQD